MIITLPITVRENAPLGYWLTPVLMDALSKQLQENATLFYGRLGLRESTPLTEGKFQNHLDSLGVQGLRQSDLEHKAELLSLVKRVYEESSTATYAQECFKCPCGALELPAKIASFAKEKTFKRVGGEYVCRVCNEPGKLLSVENTFLRVTTDRTLPSVNVYPRWYGAEVEELLKQLREQGIPLSRSRETGLKLGDMNLDVELVWQLLPLLVSLKNPDERVRLVITNHVLRQAVTALLLSGAVYPNLRADLIISPCISHPGVLEKWNLDRLNGLGYTGALIRSMLLGSLGWQVKDAALFETPSAVELRRFVLLQRHVSEASKNGGVYGLDEVLWNINQQNLNLGLKHVFNAPRFDYRTLVGLF